MTLLFSQSDFPHAFNVLYTFKNLFERNPKRDYCLFPRPILTVADYLVYCLVQIFFWEWLFKFLFPRSVVVIFFQMNAALCVSV